MLLHFKGIIQSHVLGETNALIFKNVYSIRNKILV
jgi:hypothetical protein